MAGSGNRRQYGCVPVRADKLTCMSRDVGILLEWSWTRREQEHEWEASAVAADPSDGVRQLELAGHLCSHMYSSEITLSATLGIVEEYLDEAVDLGRRPRPESAAWWRRRLPPGVPRRVAAFVHVSWEDVARLRELLADASGRARRLMAPAEDLDRECWCWPEPAPAKAAAIHATPILLERMRRAQRLADDVLVPLRALERLIGRLIRTNEPRRRVGRGRGRPATPPRAAAAASPEPMFRRSASV